MKITLEFDTPQAGERFIAWWLDGGGEQYLKFYTSKCDDAEDYLKVHGSGEIDEDQ